MTNIMYYHNIKKKIFSTTIAESNKNSTFATVLPIEHRTLGGLRVF